MPKWLYMLLGMEFWRLVRGCTEYEHTGVEGTIIDTMLRWVLG